MLKKYQPYIIFYYCFSAVLLVVAAFTDLKLDIFLNHPANLFARWFEAMGELPGKMIPTVAGVALYYASDHRALKVFGLFANFAGAAYFGVEHLHRYLFRDDLPFYIGIIFGLYIAAAAQFFGQYIRIPEKMKKPLVILSLTGIAVMFVQIGVIEAVKLLWGRVRFRDLLKAGSYDAFTAWYHPNGLNGNKSFPSGHTANAAMGYLMMLLPFLNREKWEKRSFLLFIIPFIHTGVVAYTRLVMGAHYLSDVTMGGCIGFTIVIVAMALLEKKYFSSKQL